MDLNRELTFFSFKKSAKLVQIRFGCVLDSRIYGVCDLLECVDNSVLLCLDFA